MNDWVKSMVLRPVATAVGGLLLIFFGLLAMLRIPIQLSPTIESPQVTVTTEWPGASPNEVEREIVLRQEEQLESLEGLARMESSSAEGVGWIELTFRLGTDIDQALVQVSNRLQQVRERPLEAESPVLETVGSNNNNIAWFMLRPLAVQPGSGNGPPTRSFTGDIRLLGTLAEEVIEPRLERVPGVARALTFGAREPEMRIWVEPADLAARRVTLTQLVDALRRENRDWSSGDFDEGKRRYLVRSVGAFRTPEDIGEVAIAVRDGLPVRVADVARIELGHADLREAGFYLGEPTVGISIQKKAGANVLEVMSGLRAAVEELDRGPLRDHGLQLQQSYDETEYIGRAIDLVRQSLLLGAVLAATILFLFLRSHATTLIVAIAIPTSLLGTFVVFWLTGRTLNVISMAGMAFAVGMVVDNSIVVVENIYRHRQMGKSRRRAAVEGTAEVWGAVLASTLTTIAVFMPIVFLEGEIGQLFRDMALAISAAVVWSLVVALTLIPSLSAKLLERAEAKGKGIGKGGLIGRAGRLNGWISHTVYRLCGSTRHRLAVVLGATGLAIGLSLLLAPPPEYLPTGNRNFLSGFILPPPGYNVGEVTSFRQPFVDLLGPMVEADGERAREMPGGGVQSFYFVAGSTYAVLGVQARDPERVRELLPEMREAAEGLPGSIAFFEQRSVFENVLARGRSIEIDVSGPELGPLLEIAGQVYASVSEVLPDAAARPIPGLDLANPEVRLLPNRRRAAELGLGSDDIGLVVSSLVDGAFVGHYLHEGREIDLRVKAGGLGGADVPGSIDGLGPKGAVGSANFEDIPLATPDGHLVTLGSVARMVRARGPEEIRRVGRERTITIQVLPPESMPLATAMARLESEVLDPARAAGVLTGSYSARLSGSADQLVRMAGSLKWILACAVLITFLLMSALFESFVYPFVILWTVPLAALGGFLGLRLLGLFAPQGLDVLTMLGFVILIGTVVNNAILLVHQTLHHQREDEMSSRDAITAATRSRVRPIFMSVATSVFGMLPLVLVPGAGSELYRGLGSVVIGGLLLSTLLTLFVVPSLLGLVFDGRRGMLGQMRNRMGYRPDDSSRYDVLRPEPSGFVAHESSGKIEL